MRTKTLEPVTEIEEIILDTQANTESVYKIMPSRTQTSRRCKKKERPQRQQSQKFKSVVPAAKHQNQTMLDESPTSAFTTSMITKAIAIPPKLLSASSNNESMHSITKIDTMHLPVSFVTMLQVRLDGRTAVQTTPVFASHMNIQTFFNSEIATGVQYNTIVRAHLHLRGSGARTGTSC